MEDIHAKKRAVGITSQRTKPTLKVYSWTHWDREDLVPL